MRLLLVTGLVVSMCGLSPARADPRHSFAPADLFALRHAGDVQVSPDGRQVAYVRASANITIDGDDTDVMMIDVADRHEKLIERSATMPRWSPDGRTLAYVADGTHIVIRPIDKGAPSRIDSPGGIATLAWSPDSRHLAYTAFVAEPAAAFIPPVAKPAGANWAPPPRVITGAPYQQDGQEALLPGHTQLFVIDADGSGRLQLTSAKTDIDGPPIWTRKADALIFSAQPVDFRQHLYTNARLYRIGRTGGTPVPISPAGIGARSPAISPDGRTIAFVGSRPTGHDYVASILYLMDADGRHWRSFAPNVDAILSAPIFAADGQSLLAIHPEHGTTVLTRFDLNGETRTVVQSLGGDAGFSMARDGTIAFPSGSFDHPADVAVTTSTGRVRLLTSLNEALLHDQRLATIHSFPFRSSLDGVSIGAWLVCPPDRGCRKLSLILMIHGGPYGYDDPTWNSEDQLLAAAGYAILHVNYRGSIGYGFAFADRIARDFPGPSYTDLMSGVDAVIAAGVADRDHLFVAGGSAGGMLAAWTVGSTDRFKAAAVVKPVINEISSALVTDQFAASADGVGAFPWADPMAYWRRSPLSLVGNVATPTLVMVGDEDHRTPIGEAQQFFNALQLRGISSQLVVFPGAGHASIYGTPSRLAAGVALQIDWFRRHD